MKKIILILVVMLLSCVVTASPTNLRESISHPAINFICGIFNGIKLIAGGVASVVFVYSGIKYMGEADDPGARKNARDYMKWALIGIILVLMADMLLVYIVNDPASALKNCSYW